MIRMHAEILAQDQNGLLGLILPLEGHGTADGARPRTSGNQGG
jgi:hypothetical protein